MIKVGDTVKIIGGNEIFIGQEAEVMEIDKTSQIGMTWYHCNLPGQTALVWFEQVDIEELPQEGTP
jgi:ribosomal protein L24